MPERSLTMAELLQGLYHWLDATMAAMAANDIDPATAGCWWRPRIIISLVWQAQNRVQSQVWFRDDDGVAHAMPTLSALREMPSPGPLMGCLVENFVQRELLTCEKDTMVVSTPEL